MTELDPISVILKFGFLAVLYLFLLWVARSALQGPAHHDGHGPRATGRRDRACTPPRSG